MIQPSSGFLFDLDRCTGCHACVLACSTENELSWGESWRQIVTFNAEHQPALPTFHLSLACNHCAEAPCMRHCPALAIRRDGSTGAVLIEEDLCIGCKYCSWACPYDAPRFDAGAQVMNKCTWCNHRLGAGREPACVELCPTTALRVGPLVGNLLVPGFPDTPAQPAIRFLASGDGPRAPECTWQAPEEPAAALEHAPRDARAISLRSEWPLWIFTSLAAALVGWTWATSVGARTPGLALFVALTLAAAAAATLHLGRKLRAWRAVLNLRSSWLSREIAGFGAFVALGALYQWSERPWLGLAAGVAGLLTLFSIDRVYDIVRPRGSLRLHSADTVLVAAALAALLARSVAVFALVAGIRLVLYLQRKSRAGNSTRTPALCTPIRLAALALPLLLWIALPGAWLAWAILALAVGESIDRAEFYEELEVVSPRRQARFDAAGRAE
jgi:DMSO reductase iron-sulfur subunit